MPGVIAGVIVVTMEQKIPEENPGKDDRSEYGCLWLGIFSRVYC